MISLAGFADYRGWSLVRPTELHNCRSRFATTRGRTASLYRGSPHYFGGK